MSRLLLVSVSGVILLWHSTLQAQQVPPIPPDLDRNFIRGDQQRLLEEQQQRLEELQNLPGEQAEPPSPEAAEPSPCIDIAQVSCPHCPD
ncbi:hypothetical protein [Halomonas cupida]|uniref:hypothetical protein n=1 Tax=Halomonas cupida TaxID=44933 RepID=UPI0011BF8B16|nr:hypothetical protein [Halomonas cupida]